jgi:hydroxymethylglutaryl-CoA reductase
MAAGTQHKKPGAVSARASHKTFQIALSRTSHVSGQTEFPDCLTEPVMAELMVDDVNTYDRDSYVQQDVPLSLAKGAVVAALEIASSAISAAGAPASMSDSGLSRPPSSA